MHHGHPLQKHVLWDWTERKSREKLYRQHLGWKTFMWKALDDRSPLVSDHVKEVTAEIKRKHHIPEQIFLRK